MDTKYFIISNSIKKKEVKTQVCLTSLMITDYIDKSITDKK
jgi:hypothetical protein